MKKSLIALAALSAFSLSAFATCQGGYCPPVATSGAAAHASGSNMIVGGSAASARSSGNGSSFSFGSNITRSSADVSVGANAVADRTLAGKVCTTTIGGSVNLAGNVATSSESVAYNVSSGNASGAAAAGGLATAQVSGHGAFAGATKNGAIGGVAAGEASSHSGNAVLAGTNQSGFAFAANASGFESSVAGQLALTADGSSRRGCITCDKPYADSKEITSSNTAYSESVKNTERGFSDLGNAVVVNKAGGNANAVSGGTGWAKISAKDVDVDVARGR